MPNNSEILQNCLRALQCRDPREVKDWLKMKDKFLEMPIRWIFKDPKYRSWESGDDACLLWIRGGAGKGKTMISIGLIEPLQPQRDDSTVVTYFFCQNDDSELNTLGAIIKGLLLQLIQQREELGDYLVRSHWDNRNNRFDVNVTSWKALWGIFMELLDRCRNQRVYVIVDGLDECQDEEEEVTSFMKHIVHTGLGQIRWLLTSRPLETRAEKELLTGVGQGLLSLELNFVHISNGVRSYIISKVDELGILQSYGKKLREAVERELTAKAEDTYLWVSLVCNELRGVCRDKALDTIQSFPRGLHRLYDRMFDQLTKGNPASVKKCKQLLKVCNDQCSQSTARPRRKENKKKKKKEEDSGNGKHH